MGNVADRTRRRGRGDGATRSPSCTHLRRGVRAEVADDGPTRRARHRRRRRCLADLAAARIILRQASCWASGGHPDPRAFDDRGSRRFCSAFFGSRRHHGPALTFDEVLRTRAGVDMIGMPVTERCARAPGAPLEGLQRAESLVYRPSARFLQKLRRAAGSSHALLDRLTSARMARPGGDVDSSAFRAGFLRCG